MRALRLLAVPYDSGHRSRRQGLGPAVLIEHLQWSHAAEVAWVETESEFPTELATSFELVGKVAREVGRAMNDDRFPLVVAGNCMTSALGGAAGLRIFDPAADLGLIWFDAHADFNTPEIDPHGFLDGQGLAILTGRCWQELAGRIPGFQPLPDRSVVLVGADDLDERERVALAGSDITHITSSQIATEGVEISLRKAVRAVATRVSSVYVHVDLDVIDARFARANSYASSGGLAPEQLFEAVRVLTDHLPISAAGLAAYDPTADEEGRIPGVAAQTMGLLSQAFAGRRSAS
jgi:arginase